MIMFFRLLFLLCPFISLISANNYDEYGKIEIKLFSTLKDQRVQLRIKSGSFYLISYMDNKRIDTIQKVSASDNQTLLYIQDNESKLQINHSQHQLGFHSEIRLVPVDPGATYLLKYRHKERTYKGGLKMVRENGNIELVGQFDLEHYVEGVVEAEAGHVDYPEFLKVQAIIARTYAVRNFYRFLEYGYNLKDDVSCQVFHGAAHLKHKDDIARAVKQTRGMVLVDTTDQVIQAIFHANSGGITASAEDVWGNHIYYLNRKVDTFSLQANKTHWEKDIPVKTYHKFFEKRHNKLYWKLVEKEQLGRIYNVKQTVRRPFFNIKGTEISYRKLREYFKLRSTFFDIQKEGNLIKLKGKGFGHGIGLSQQGAIQMAKRRYNFKQIIDFYYPQVFLKKYY